MSTQSITHRILTVSDLTRLIRDSLESGFPDLWIEGEVSNIRMPGSGHVYFTLKDGQSQVRMVWFRSGFQHVRFSLKEGLHVLTRGRVTVYEPRGEYQVIVEYVEPRGIGALQLAFEQTKERLAREGLFLESRKRPLPSFPRAVGVVTSSTGAAIRDIITVACRRWPVRIVLASVPVQGAGAAERIAAAIDELSASDLVDVMIVGRGGGSWEDLWSFNEEVVVRAIVRSRVPVVSAVGHEVDVTLADFAADYRAPTPSAAAEAVVPVRDHVSACVVQWVGRMIRCMQATCVLHGRRLADALRVFEVMRRRMQTKAQYVDELTSRMIASVRQRVAICERRLRTLDHAVSSSGPGLTVKECRVGLLRMAEQLERHMHASLSSRRHRLHRYITGLDALSPLAILGRGYSTIHRISDNHLVKRWTEVREGDSIRARLAAGELVCLVQRTLPDSTP